MTPNQTATGHQLRAILPKLDFTKTDPYAPKQMEDESCFKNCLMPRDLLPQGLTPTS